MNFLKVLFNPIFLLAAGLHAGLLLIPVAGGSSEDLVPAPDPEGESITVTRIPPPTSAVNPGTANRPATSPQTANKQKSTATAGTRQRPGQRTQSPQSSQRPNRNSSTDGDSSSQASTNSDAPMTSDEPAPGLPDLPSDTNRVPVAVSPAEPVAQAAPTLVALSEGLDQRSVPERLRKFLARLQYRWKGTQDWTVADAQAAWLAELRPTVSAESLQALDKPLAISYPVTIEEEEGPRQIHRCLNPRPEAGLIGTVVDTDGAIAGEPKLLRSSGYPFINDVALREIQNYKEFPNERGQKIYTVPFEVDYDEDACIGLAELSVDP